MKPKDLTGQRFGRLTVLSLNPIPYRSPSGKPTRRWDCVCDCGNKVTVLMVSSQLRRTPREAVAASSVKKRRVRWRIWPASASEG